MVWPLGTSGNGGAEPISQPFYYLFSIIQKPYFIIRYLRFGFGVCNHGCVLTRVTFDILESRGNRWMKEEKNHKYSYEKWNISFVNLIFFDIGQLLLLYLGHTDIHVDQNRCKYDG